MQSKHHKGTRVVHAGLSEAQQGKPFIEGPTFASTFHLSGNVENADYQYARFGNPTWSALESGLAELEGGETVIFPSGLAAAAAILTSTTKQGDKVVLPADGYSATRAYVKEFLVPFGVEIFEIPTRDLLQADYSGVALVLVESPSNPLLDTVDIRLLADCVHADGGLLAIDNTTATVMYQTPLSLGADFSMSADTKALNGHSDVVFGHVSSSQGDLVERVRLWRKLAGNIPGPMETWLVHRGLSTLDIRLERMSKNAQHLAEFLSQHDKVLSVRYPGLETDPSYSVALKQMSGFGFIISFDLGTKAQADAFLDGIELVFEATSFGGVHTMAERRARWGSDDVSEGLIRLSVGCERHDDLLNAVSQALDNV